MLRKLFRYLAFRQGKASKLYRYFWRPDAREWAEFVRLHGGLYHMGTDCSIHVHTWISDPAYTWIGDRVMPGELLRGLPRRLHRDAQ